MPAAEELIAIGEARGVSVGVARGEAIGRLKMLRRIMGLPELDGPQAAAMSLEELETSFGQLEAEYNRQFNRL
jgi:hypothetical protein